MPRPGEESAQRSESEQTILPRLFSVSDTAQHLGVSSRTVRRWIDEELVPIHRLGRQIRIAEPDLASFIR